MSSIIDPLEQLIDAAQLIKKPEELEEKLKEVAFLTAKVLKTKRCLILLLTDPDETSDDSPDLRVFGYSGNLPESAYNEQILLDKSIASYVATYHKKSLLIEDIRQFPLSKSAKYIDEPDKSLMSAPILEESQIIGLINVSFPLSGQTFTQEDLQLLEIFASFISKSLQITDLQRILRSKFVERAVIRELGEGEVKESMTIHPDPHKLAKIVAKSFFRELTQAGFGANEIIGIATEVLTLLNTSLEKHRQRLARDEGN